MDTNMLALLNEKFKGKKTYATAIAAVSAALIAYFGGEATLFQALQLGFTGVLGGTLRHCLACQHEEAMKAD
jgi:hypothetical protein